MMNEIEKLTQLTISFESIESRPTKLLMHNQYIFPQKRTVITNDLRGQDINTFFFFNLSL